MIKIFLQRVTAPSFSTTIRTFAAIPDVLRNPLSASVTSSPLFARITGQRRWFASDQGIVGADSHAVLEKPNTVSLDGSISTASYTKLLE